MDEDIAEDHCAATSDMICDCMGPEPNGFEERVAEHAIGRCGPEQIGDAPAEIVIERSCIDESIVVLQVSGDLQRWVEVDLACP